MAERKAATKGFTDEERAAIRDRAQELKAADDEARIRVLVKKAVS